METNRGLRKAVHRDFAGFRPVSGLQKALEAFLELAAGAEEQALDSRDGGAKDLGDFLVRHFLVSAENYSRPLRLGKGSNRTVDCLLKLCLRHFVGCRAGGGIGVPAGRMFRILGIQGHETCPAVAPHFVEDQVAGDGEKPGGEFCGGIVAGCALPDSNEDLLGNVLRIRLAAEHLGDRTHDPELVPQNQSLKRLFVALLHVEHEGDIVRLHIFIGSGSVCHRRKSGRLNHEPGRLAREIPLAERGGIGFSLSRSMIRPIVASYCTTFLKPEMLHIYRQVGGLKRYDTFVITRELMCADRFPFEDIEVLPEPDQPVLRRMYLKFIKRTGALHYRGEAEQLAKLFARRQADLMHVYFGHTGVHLRAFLKEWEHPSVVSFHGADIMLREHRPEYAVHMGELFGIVTLVLARSRSLVERLEAAGCPPEKIRLNRTGIPLEDFPFVDRQHPQDGSWRLLQASRLIKKKGLHTTLLAFKKFRTSFPKATLTIAGEGPMRKELEHAVAGMGLGDAVTLPGFLREPELKALYSKSHIFLHPSETTDKQDQEGVPNSMLEAMANGLPVAATWHGGIPEAVSDGISGILVPEKSPDSLTAALVRMASDPGMTMEMGRRASQSVREEFEQSRTIGKLEEIYDEALSIGKPSSNCLRS